ncbi:MAG: zf-TFIIB domain-containing protein [Thermodesulfobacteriota bacterium]
MEMPEREVKRLLCPGCGAVLGGVYVEANYGRVLLVDQCPECGGVWFDRWELYFLRPGSLKKLVGVDTERFLAAHPAPAAPPDPPGDCPGCERPLEPFVDPTLPEDAEIKRCARCSGLWLNRGGLARYAEYRAAKGPEVVTEAAGAEGKAARLEVLKRLQKELKTADIAERPGPFGDARLAAAAEPLDGREFAKDAAFLILQALAGLVFKV